MGNVINAQSSSEKHVLPSHLGGGPMNLGDPDDRTLRKVETDILIMNLIREKTHKEKCHLEAKALDKCGGEASFLVGFKCRKERDDVLECSKKWFFDENFRNECTEEYLKRRSYYRRTGRPGHLYVEEETGNSTTPQNIS